MVHSLIFVSIAVFVRREVICVVVVLCLEKMLFEYHTNKRRFDSVWDTW